MLAHVQASGHSLCGCGAYHYPHRPGSGCCVLNPLGALHDAARRHASEDDLCSLAAATITDHPETAEKVASLFDHWRIKR